MKASKWNIIKNYWRQACVNGNAGLSWELMKFETRSLAISIGKKKNEEIELEIIIRILSSSRRSDLSSQEIIELSKLKAQLDDIHEEKAKGAFTRSRLRQMDKYFFNLEK